MTLEALPVGADAWTPVATGTATGRGHPDIPTSVPAHADYRVVSGAPRPSHRCG